MTADMLSDESLRAILIAHKLWVDSGGIHGESACFENVRFSWCQSLSHSQLAGADFMQCQISNMDFRCADLKCTDFIDCDLTYSDFRGSDLRYAYFSGCDFKDYDSDGSDFRGAIMTDTFFGDEESSAVSGLRGIERRND